ncbi:MAG: hypothetical protein Q9M37_10900 [Desulfonauticus sp.]|nr:hypothetical protein [Desulfonauticus sp.]
MCNLKQFRDLPIDWEMTQEDAITRHLEWGNNPYKGERRAVQFEGESSYYFVVNTWDEPKVMLIKMSASGPEELATLMLPKDLVDDFYKQMGQLKGVFPITPKIKEWLQEKMEI